MSFAELGAVDEHADTGVTEPDGQQAERPGDVAGGARNELGDRAVEDPTAGTNETDPEDDAERRSPAHDDAPIAQAHAAR